MEREEKNEEKNHGPYPLCHLLVLCFPAEAQRPVKVARVGFSIPALLQGTELKWRLSPAG